MNFELLIAMKTLFLFPTEEEAAPFRERRPDAPVRICGVGQARAAAATARLIASEKPDRIVLAGVAGAYGDEPAIGSVCVVEEERETGLPDKYAAVFRPKSLPSKLPHVVSNTVAVQGVEPRGAQIENMEGAAVMAVCEALGVDCCEVRAISNRTGQPFGEWKKDEATTNLAEILIKKFYNKYAEFMKSSTKWIMIGVAVLILVLLVLFYSSELYVWAMGKVTTFIIWVLLFGVGYILGYVKGRSRTERKMQEVQKQ